jgi:hypothetical protein
MVPLKMGRAIGKRRERRSFELKKSAKEEERVSPLFPFSPQQQQ